MKIDRINYERYAIDYLERQLSPEATEAMRRFLDENRDLAEEILEMKQINFTHKQVQGSINKKKYFKNYSDLQEINSENIEELCIAYFEHDLDTVMHKSLLLFLNAHPEDNNQFDIYAKIRFTADPNIHFPNRNKLLKKSELTFRRVASISLSVAAACILFILLYTKEIRQEIVTPVMQANTNEVYKIEKPETLSQKEDVTIRTLQKKETKMPADKVLAPFDTNNSQQNKKVRLAQTPFLQSEEVSSNEPAEVYSIHTPAENTLPEVFSEEKIERIPIPEDKIITKTSRRKILVGALKAGIKGINKLTENNMAIHTELSDAGDFREIELRSGNFEFERKNSSNIKNN